VKSQRKKRVADWCEKASVAAFAVGAFQHNESNYLICFIFATFTFIISLWLTEEK